MRRIAIFSCDIDRSNEKMDMEEAINSHLEKYSASIIEIKWLQSSASLSTSVPCAVVTHLTAIVVREV